MHGNSLCMLGSMIGGGPPALLPRRGVSMKYLLSTAAVMLIAGCGGMREQRIDCTWGSLAGEVHTVQMQPSFGGREGVVRLQFVTDHGEYKSAQMREIAISKERRGFVPIRIRVKKPCWQGPLAVYIDPTEKKGRVDYVDGRTQALRCWTIPFIPGMDQIMCARSDAPRGWKAVK